MNVTLCERCNGCTPAGQVLLYGRHTQAINSEINVSLLCVVGFPNWFQLTNKSVACLGSKMQTKMAPNRQHGGKPLPLMAGCQYHSSK